MIFANINQNLPYLPENVKECLEFAKKNDLLSFEPGSYEIDGKRLFVNIAEYETTERENRPWEAHKDYLDLHLMLRGTKHDKQSGKYTLEAKQRPTSSTAGLLGRIFCSNHAGSLACRGRRPEKQEVVK